MGYKLKERRKTKKQVRQKIKESKELVRAILDCLQLTELVIELGTR